ncbi:MAG TPA: hypothetical protein VEL06_14245 [Haliangiales bacterium]|nr:hypothetical protein [Haliangiales bacterium]
MIRKVVIGVVLLIFFVIFLPFLSPLLTQLVFRLPFGWIAFLGRVLPKVTVNWSGIGMVVASSTLIVVGMQWFCSWVYEQVTRAKHQGEARHHWSWRWTFSLYVGLWLLFFAIMGAVGIAHQIGWLLVSKEPVYVARESFLINLKQAGLSLAIAGADEDWDLAKTRAWFAGEQTPFIGESRNLIEIFDLLLFEGGDGKIAAAVLFYRDSKKRARSGLAVIEVTTNAAFPEIKFERESALPEILARYKKRPKGNSE